MSSWLSQQTFELVLEGGAPDQVRGALAPLGSARGGETLALHACGALVHLGGQRALVAIPYGASEPEVLELLASLVAAARSAGLQFVEPPQRTLDPAELPARFRAWRADIEARAAQLAPDPSRGTTRALVFGGMSEPLKWILAGFIVLGLGGAGCAACSEYLSRNVHF